VSSQTHVRTEQVLIAIFQCQVALHIEAGMQ
jgi:hypothetical protein